MFSAGLAELTAHERQEKQQEKEKQQSEAMTWAELQILTVDMSIPKWFKNCESQASSSI